MLCHFSFLLAQAILSTSWKHGNFSSQVSMSPFCCNFSPHVYIKFLNKNRLRDTDGASRGHVASLKFIALKYLQITFSIQRDAMLLRFHEEKSIYRFPIITKTCAKIGTEVSRSIQ